MFELQITDTDVTSGTIPVSWCLDKETLAEVEARVGTNPQVVIVVAPTKKYHISKESRQVVPLRDLMAYVNFRSSGHNRIWAFISSTDTKSTRCKYLARDSYRWATSIVNPDGDGWGYNFRQTAMNGDKVEQWFEPQWGSFVDVNVPAEVFAPEPSARERAWVNHFFKLKAVDQCDFRRRRLFAYTVQPVFMAVQWVARLFITVLALLIGARNFSFQPLIHPLQYSMHDQMDVLTGGSIFIRKVPSIENESFSQFVVWLAKKVMFLPFMPIVLVVVLFSILVNPMPLLVATGMIVAVALILGAIGLGLYLFKDGGWGELFDWIDSVLARNTAALNEEETQMLVCTPDRKPVTMKSLPSKKKTIRLRFLDLKSKVCKPFSG